jgi:membrane protein DedA with SNARE-associated domain
LGAVRENVRPPLAQHHRPISSSSKSSGEESIEPVTELIHTLETFVLTFSGDVYDFMGWFGVVVLMAIESTAIPLPSEIIMPLAGWRLVLDEGHGVPHVLLAGFWGAVGSLIGSLAEYYVSRAGGRPFIEKYGKYILITHKDLERADRWFQTRGELTVFIARMIPGVRGFISIPAGIARMNIVRFSIFTFIGALPWTIGLAWGGYLLGDNYDTIRDVSKPFDIPIAAVIIVVVAWFLWKRIKEVRSDSAISKSSTD